MEERIVRVLAVLEELGIEWALIGAQACNTYLADPRTTSDFDFVVDAKRIKRLLDKLEQEFEDLELIDLGPAIRLRALDIDLVRSDTHLLFREALSRKQRVGSLNVPAAEVLLVLKYLSATSPWRSPERRAQDIVDLMNLYRARGEQLDRALVSSLAAQVYPGAERELDVLLERIDRGDKITI